MDDVFTFRVYPVDPEVTLDRAIDEELPVRVEGPGHLILALVSAGQEALGLELVKTEVVH